MPSKCEYQIELPVTHLGEDRSIGVSPIDGDVLLRVYEHKAMKAGFRIPDDCIPTFIAGAFGYYSKIQADLSYQEKLTSAVGGEPRTGQQDWFPDVQLQQIAKGQFEDINLNNRRRGQFALAPLFADRTGLYYAKSQNGVDEFVMLGYGAEDSRGRHNNKVFQRARFAPEDIPIIGGVVCKFATKKTQAKVARIPLYRLMPNNQTEG